jgi:hypothetical protein
MKPVLNENDPMYYVDTSEMIEFININSPMTYIQSSNLIWDSGIALDGEASFWVKRDVLENSNLHDPEAVKWVKAFFKAHPWIEKMAVVYGG